MKRPLGVTILAVLALVAAVAELAWATTLGWGGERGIPGEAWWITAIAPLARVLLGLLYAFIGIGLWRLRRWARGVVIVLSALAIGSAAFSVVWGRQLTGFWVPLWLLLPVGAIYALCLGYMFTGKVRQAFSP